MNIEIMEQKEKSLMTLIAKINAMEKRANIMMETTEKSKKAPSHKDVSSVEAGSSHDKLHYERNIEKKLAKEKNEISNQKQSSSSNGPTREKLPPAMTVDETISQKGPYIVGDLNTFDSEDNDDFSVGNNQKSVGTENSSVSAGRKKKIKITNDGVKKKTDAETIENLFPNEDNLSDANLALETANQTNEKMSQSFGEKPINESSIAKKISPKQLNPIPLQAVEKHGVGDFEASHFNQGLEKGMDGDDIPIRERVYQMMSNGISKKEISNQLNLSQVECDLIVNIVSRQIRIENERRAKLHRKNFMV